MELIKRDLYLNRLIERRENGLIRAVTGIRKLGNPTCCSSCIINTCWTLEWMFPELLPFLWTMMTMRSYVIVKSEAYILSNVWLETVRGMCFWMKFNFARDLKLSLSEDMSAYPRDKYAAWINYYTYSDPPLILFWAGKQMNWNPSIWLTCVKNCIWKTLKTDITWGRTM